MMKSSWAHTEYKNKMVERIHPPVAGHDDYEVGAEGPLKDNWVATKKALTSNYCINNSYTSTVGSIWERMEMVIPIGREGVARVSDNICKLIDDHVKNC